MEYKGAFDVAVYDNVDYDRMSYVFGELLTIK